MDLDFMRDELGRYSRHIVSSSQHAALFDLTGRVALVTGASRGLGAAMSVGLARAGAEVILNGREQATLDTHLTALFRLSKLLVPGMKARGRGKIIATGSLASELGRGTITPYASAKGGLKMFIRALAVELGPHNIQCNAIGPGWFDTDMNRPLLNNPEWLATVKRRCPAGRYAAPEEIAGTAVFLASPASDFVSGQLVFVDGGATANMM